MSKSISFRITDLLSTNQPNRIENSTASFVKYDSALKSLITNNFICNNNSNGLCNCLSCKTMMIFNMKPIQNKPQLDDDNSSN